MELKLDNAVNEDFNRTAPAATPLATTNDPLLWYASLDRSGSPDLKAQNHGNAPYVVVFALLRLPKSGLSALSEDLRALRTRLGMSHAKEFHGHQLSEEVRADVLRVALNYDLRIGAILVDKERTVSQWNALYNGNPALPNSAYLQRTTTEFLFRIVVERYAIAKLWADEDARGEAALQERTALQRIHRDKWSDAKFSCQHKASKSNDLIQIADVAAYNLSVHARGAIRTDALRNEVKILLDDPNNMVLGPGAWLGLERGLSTSE